MITNEKFAEVLKSLTKEDLDGSINVLDLSKSKFCSNLMPNRQ